MRFKNNPIIHKCVNTYNKLIMNKARKYNKSINITKSTNQSTNRDLQWHIPQRGSSSPVSRFNWNLDWSWFFWRDKSWTTVEACKWSNDRKWSWDCTVNDPRLQMVTSTEHLEMSGLRNLGCGFKIYPITFFITMKLRKLWTFGFDSKRLIWYSKPVAIKFRTCKATFDNYINTCNILT